MRPCWPNAPCSPRLQGGCLAPIAGLGQVEGEQLTLIGRVISHDGARLLEARQTAPSSQAEMLGWQVAEALLAQGAGDLVRLREEARSPARSDCKGARFFAIPSVFAAGQARSARELISSDSTGRIKRIVSHRRIVG